MSVQLQWLRRTAVIVAFGIVFAVVVTEIELAMGFDLLDAPFFHAPQFAIALTAAALVFAVFQARPATTGRGIAAAVVAFGIPVLPFNALSERPPIPMEFWRGNAGLFLPRAMTIGRSHSVVLVIAGPKPLEGTKTAGPADAHDAVGADLIVARLFGEPRSAFTVMPDKDQPQPISLAGDMRWVWAVTPRQQGPQRLVLQLDTVAKNYGSADAVSNLYRQLIVVTVQPPSWYEAARGWLIGFVVGS
jgi:hypothetical protein